MLTLALAPTKPRLWILREKLIVLVLLTCAGGVACLTGLARCSEGGGQELLAAQSGIAAA